MKKINSLVITAILAICVILPLNAFSMPFGGIPDKPTGLTDQTNQCTVTQTPNAEVNNFLSYIFSAAIQQISGGNTSNVIDGIFGKPSGLASGCNGNLTPPPTQSMANSASPGNRLF